MTGDVKGESRPENEATTEKKPICETENERHRVGLPRWLSSKESTCEDRRDGFDP